MKKITLILIITALSVAMFVAVASADSKVRCLHGAYEMSLKGNGLSSTFPGFDGPDEFGVWEPIGSEVWGSTDTAYGTFIFNCKGYGTASGRNFAFDFPPGNPVDYGGPVSRSNGFFLEFDYHITHEGNMTVTVNNTWFPLEMTGKVSKDKKTIILTNTNTLIPFPPPWVTPRPDPYPAYYSLFTATRILIKVQKNVKDDD